MLKRANQQKILKMLFMTFGVLVVMLITVLVIIATSGGGDRTISQIIEKGKFVEGVSIAGVDVGGMTYDEAAADSAIKNKFNQAYDGFSYTFTVQGVPFTYTAADMGLDNGLEKSLENALAWGNTGADARAQADEARQSGKDFPAGPYADWQKVAAALQPHKAEYDVAAKDATIKFDETAGEEGQIIYVDEIDGVDVDMNGLSMAVSDKVNNLDIATIEATDGYAIITPPRVTTEDLKANISPDPIGTFTSYFKGSGLSLPARVNNIVLMGGIVNGTVIEPGETWSMNDAAGPRNAQTAKTVGWTMAHGLNNGRVEDEYGGGVCQISSTTFNAAIRAELTIVKRTPHSWKSDYIEEGFDATISTGNPDLVLQNPYQYPVFIACKVDTEAKSATVSVYGPPNPNGYSVEFTKKKIKDNFAPASVYYYNKTQDPDGNPIDPNTKVEWITSRNGAVWQLYKQYVDKDGNKVGEAQPFMTTTYKTFQGVYYCNYPETGPVATPTATP